MSKPSSRQTEFKKVDPRTVETYAKAPSPALRDAQQRLVQHLELAQVYVVHAEPGSVVLHPNSPERVKSTLDLFSWPADLPFPDIRIQQHE